MSDMGGQAGMSDGGGAGAASSGRRRGRRLVTFLAWVVTLFVAAIVVGALFPPFRLIAIIGTIFESFFTLHVFIAGLIGIALALWARALGGRTWTTIILLLAILATIGAAAPIYGLHRMAHRHGARISWTQHLLVFAPGPKPKPDQTKLFATVDGKNLYLDVYLPPGSSAGNANAGAPAMAMAPACP